MFVCSKVPLNEVCLYFYKIRVLPLRFKIFEVQIILYLREKQNLYGVFFLLWVFQQFVQPMNVPLKSYELLNRMTGKGLGITYKFTRTISVFSPKMVSIELTLTNHGDNQLSGIKIGKKVG